MKRDLGEMESFRGATCWENSLLAWDRQVFECLQCKPSPTDTTCNVPPSSEGGLGLCTGHSSAPALHPTACTRWVPWTAAGPETCTASLQPLAVKLIKDCW